MTNSNTTVLIIKDAFFLALTIYASYYLATAFNPFKDRMSRQKKLADKRKQTLEKLQIKDITLNEYEETIFGEVIVPSDISESFADIGGLDLILDDLKESVVLPLCHSEFCKLASQNSLLSAPKGVLLYGPPGVGKTLIAKALAKESNARFLNVRLSTLTDKYLGESEKLVHAVFSLAEKLQPAIIFIDEIDSLMRERQVRDHETISMMKAEFMTLWDGLSTNSHCQIVVLGATNRPEDIDSAFLRRMPKKFKIDLPDSTQRISILQKLLKDQNISTDINYKLLSSQTQGFSGSDLKELCRNVVMIPLQEQYRLLSKNSTAEFNAPRPITMHDFELKLSEIREHAKATNFSPGEIDLAKFQEFVQRAMQKE